MSQQIHRLHSLFNLKWNIAPRESLADIIKMRSVRWVTFLYLMNVNQTCFTIFNKSWIPAKIV